MSGTQTAFERILRMLLERVGLTPDHYIVGREGVAQEIAEEIDADNRRIAYLEAEIKRARPVVRLYAAYARWDRASENGTNAEQSAAWAEYLDALRAAREAQS